LNTYEGMFIFQESLKDDALEASVKDVREEIEKLGGSIENTARMGRRPFAREQARHQKAGHYVVMNFLLAPEQIATLWSRLRLKEEVFRSQIIRQPVAKEAAAGAKG
jgi:ribosomal protein S6